MKNRRILFVIAIWMTSGIILAQNVKQYTASVVLEAGAEAGDSPVWDAANQRFYWVDTEKGFLHSYNPESEKTTSKYLGHKVSAVVPTRYNNVILGLDDGIFVYNLNTGRRYRMAHPLKDKPGLTLSDGKCDPQGRFWISSKPASKNKLQGALHRLSPNFVIRQVLDSLQEGNGMAWSADGKTLYYIDSPTYEIWAFDFETQSGNISNKRVAVRIPPSAGMPDGMAIDANGHLWVSMNGSGSVTCWNPNNGQQVAHINVPGVKKVTSCAFGGKNFSQLIITTAKAGLSDEELEQYPNSGHLFMVNVDVSGQAPHYFNER